MTTIAYRDGIIAYDSLITCQGSAIYQDYDKSRFVNNTRFFLSGAICDYDKFISDWFEEERSKYALDCSAVVFDGVQLYEGGYGGGKLWKEKVDEKNYFAIGSGWQYALVAMDFGASAEKAVERAAYRCLYTGGRIRTFKIW